MFFGYPLCFRRLTPLAVRKTTKRKEVLPMSRKMISMCLALLLALSLLAGCGGESAPAGSGKSDGAVSQPESQPDPQPGQKAEPAEEAEEEPASTGPVELNQVIYDDNGIKITAVSAESHLQDVDLPGDDVPVFDLNLHIERTGAEQNTVLFYTGSVNGFMQASPRSFQIGSSKSSLCPLRYSEPFLTGGNEEDVVLCVNKDCAEALELKSVGEIGVVFEIIKENGLRSYESVNVDLGQPADPASPITAEEGCSLDEFATINVSNSSDSMMLVRCLLYAYDTAGNPLYGEYTDYETGEEYLCAGDLIAFYIRPGAESLPYALMSYAHRDENDERVDEIGSFRVEYLNSSVSSEEDLTDQVSYVMEGRWEESRNFMLFRCTWPDEYPHLEVNGTCFVYTEGGELYSIEPIQADLRNDDDYRDWSGAANPETGALDVIAIDCKNETDAEFRFEIYLSSVIAKD